MSPVSCLRYHGHISLLEANSPPPGHLFMSYYTNHSYHPTSTTLPFEMLMDLHEDADVTVYHDGEGNDEVAHSVDT